MTTILSAKERELCFDRYESGAVALEGVYRASPVEARTFKPAPGEWSIHQIVCHCADGELAGAVRVRMLAADPDPLIVGFEQDDWAVLFGYESLPIEQALAVIRASSSYTVSVLRLLPEHVWSKVGRHTQFGPYAIIDWLTYWSEHLHVHTAQIEENVKTFESQS